MNCNNISIITYMRMRIVLRRFSVSCPSGMSNTAGTRNRFSTICLFSQNFQTSFRFNDFCLVLTVANRNTRGIISTIFQLRKTIQKDRRCLMASCKTNYSTHKYFSSSLRPAACYTQTTIIM